MVCLSIHLFVPYGLLNVKQKKELVKLIEIAANAPQGKSNQRINFEVKIQC